jgi:uncharacterized protein
MSDREIRKDRMNFQDFFARMYSQSSFATKNVTFVVTEQCNLRCSYCYECHKSNKSMTSETGRKAVDMLFEQSIKEDGYINTENSQAIIIEFIGGEPLLEIDLINELVEYFKYKAITLDHPWARNYMIGMTTNGILYHDPRVQEFIKRNKYHISLTITIDGDKELHDACRLFPDGSGSYDIVEKAIRHQVATNDGAPTKLTLAPGNVAYLFKAFKNLQSLGIDEVHANCVYEEGWELEHAEVLYDQMKQLADYLLSDNNLSKITTSLFSDYIGQPLDPGDNLNYCGGTGKMLAIDTKGDLYPCLRYLPFTLQNEREPMIIGNVEKGIEHTEKQKNCISCLTCITRESQSTNECFNCPIASGCAWCSGYNYDVFGTPDKRATFICIMHKARVMANTYFWNKLYKEDGLEKRLEMNIPKEWALQIIDEAEYEMLLELAK